MVPGRHQAMIEASNIMRAIFGTLFMRFVLPE
jgi:hypothetical protein